MPGLRERDADLGPVDPLPRLYHQDLCVPVESPTAIDESDEARGWLGDAVAFQRWIEACEKGGREARMAKQELVGRLGRPALEPRDLADQNALVGGDCRQQRKNQEHDCDLDGWVAIEAPMGDDYGSHGETR